MGCMIVLLGVLLYKLSLHIQKLEKVCSALEDNDSGSRTSDDCDISYGEQSDESNTGSDSDEQNLFDDGVYDVEEEEDSGQLLIFNENIVQESSQSLLEKDNRKIV